MPELARVEVKHTGWHLHSVGSASKNRCVDSSIIITQSTSWKQGAYDLHLFLDSFDECLIRVDTLGPLLAD